MNSVGPPLDAPPRPVKGPRFGFDFSQVTVRKGPLAEETAISRRTTAAEYRAAPAAKRGMAVQKESSNNESGVQSPSWVPAIVHDALRSPSQPLDSATRAFMEPRFGHDFSRVRIHTGNLADESTRAVSALAFTVGQDVVFAHGQYAPRSAAGRQLLAHELTHVAQQSTAAEGRHGLLVGLPGSAAEREADVAAERVAAARASTPISPVGLTLQRQTAPKAPQPVENVPDANMTVSLTSLVFTVDKEGVFHEGPTRPQAMAVVLQRLLGSLYEAPMHPELTIIDEIEGRWPEGWEAPQWKGTLLPDFVAAAGDPIGYVELETPVASVLLDLLKEKYKTVDITPAQEELIRLGLASHYLWSELRDKFPTWYTFEMFQRELAQNAALLRDYSSASSDEGKKASAGAAGEALLSTVRVMEAIRLDVALAKHPKAGDAYRALWAVAKPSSDSKGLPPVPTEVTGEVAALAMLGFLRSQPGLSVTALTDSADRAILLERFAQFVERTTTLASGDEPLSDTPDKANIEAFPSTLTSSPQLQAPLFETSQQSEMLFSMQIQFPTVLDAFAGYSYFWHRLKVPEEHPVALHLPGGRQKDDVLAEEGETVKAAGKALAAADPAKLQSERATSGEVWSKRVARSTQYGMEDVSRAIKDAGGDPGIGTKSLVGANALLRYVGTAASFAVDILTETKSFGHDEQRITYPEPGVYLIACAGVPILKGTENLVRAPSVAYLPVFARDPRDIAEAASVMAAADQADAPSRIDEIKLLLDQQVPLPPERRKELELELESLEASQSGLGAVLDLQHKRLIQRKGELETKIDAISSGKEKGNIAEVRLELDGVKDEIKSVDERLDVRRKRAGELKNSQALVATFVSDEPGGQPFPLNLEIVDKGKVGDTQSVYLSDLTTSKSGMDTGQGTDKRAAIRDALDKVLSSGLGYGRGFVSFMLDDRVESVRITSTKGNLINEALQNISLAITAAAIAAAPFTGGATLSLLVPAGLIGAAPSVYRVVERNRAGTFRLDLESAMDIVNIAAALVSVGRLGAAAKLGAVANPSLRAVRVASGLMIFGFGLHGMNAVLLGASVLEQLAQIDRQPGLSDSERRAKMMMVLGNIMLQVGMEIGERVAARGHSLSEGEQFRRVDPGAIASDEEVPAGRPGGIVADRETTEKTAGGLIPGGGTPPSEAAREAEVHDARSENALFRQLAEEGMHRQSAQKGPPPTTTITPNEPRLGIKDPHEAYRLYDEALRANGGKKEAGIFRNTQTGDYAVSVGDETSVNAPGKGSWKAILHYHPNPDNAKQFRMPAPADFMGMMRAFVSGGRSVREFLEYEIPGMGRGRTEFGISADNEKPFYVTVFLPDESSSTLRFSHDGTYSSFWSGEKTYVDPESPLYKQMIRDIPQYLKGIDEVGERSKPAQPGTAGKTAAGLTPPRPPDLLDARGDLTDDGVAYLKTHYAKRFGEKTPQQVRSEFAGADAGDLLERIVKEEARRGKAAQDPGGTNLLLDANRQSLRSIANILKKSLKVDFSILRQPVLEFVKNEMPDAFEFMNNHPDKIVRAAWLEFAWGAREGGKKGSAGFLLGTVSNKEPDIVEVFPAQKQIIVTDATHRAGNPIHNFKTLFYAAVLEKMTGFNAGSVDYRSVFRQTVIDPPTTPGAAKP